MNCPYRLYAGIDFWNFLDSPITGQLQLFYTPVNIEKSRGKGESNRHPPDGSKGRYGDMVSNNHRYDSDNLKKR